MVTKTKKHSAYKNIGGGFLHDHLFKDIFSHLHYGLDLFKLSLSPAEFALFAWNTLRTDITTYVDKQLKELRADLIFSVRLRGSSKRVRIVFLLEHKSHYDPQIMKQLLSYQAEIYAKGGGFVIMIVVYAGKRDEWPGPLRFQDTLPLRGEKRLQEFFGEEVLDFRFRLLNVRKLKKTGGISDKKLTTSPILYIMSEVWDLDQKRIKEFFKLTRGIESRG